MANDSNFYKQIFENLHDGLYFVDRDRVIRYWNKAAETISGYSAEEVIGKSCQDNILVHVDGAGNNLCQGLCPLALTIRDGEPREAEVFLHHKKGHRVPVSVRISKLTNASGEIIGGVELFSDISSYKAIELKMKELEKIALLDNVTRLANRNAAERELYLRFEEHRRFDVPFGILFMDIDNFKNVNDTYGHDVGDRVLRFVADTLVHNARPFDLIARWGGDEFIGIIRNINHQPLDEVGNRLRFLITSSYITLKDEKLQVSISIGATVIQENDTIETLLKRADTLLYESKCNGRNCLTVG